MTITGNVVEFRRSAPSFVCTDFACGSSLHCTFWIPDRDVFYCMIHHSNYAKFHWDGEYNFRFVFSASLAVTFSSLAFEGWAHKNLLLPRDLPVLIHWPHSPNWWSRSRVLEESHVSKIDHHYPLRRQSMLLRRITAIIYHLVHFHSVYHNVFVNASKARVSLQYLVDNPQINGSGFSCCIRLIQFLSFLYIIEKECKFELVNNSNSTIGSTFHRLCGQTTSVTQIRIPIKLRHKCVALSQYAHCFHFSWLSRYSIVSQSGSGLCNASTKIPSHWRLTIA